MLGNMKPELLTLRDAARLLGLSASTLAHQARIGHLRARKLGDLWIVEPREVERYRAESRGRPGRRAGRRKRAEGARRHARTLGPRGEG